MKTTPLFLCTLLPLCGCLLGPDHVRPETPVGLPEAFRTTLDAAAAPDAAAAVSTNDVPAAVGWAAWNDPTLQTLLETATASNLTIRASLTRLAQSRATLAESRASLFPSLSASGSGSRTRSYDPKNYASSYQGGLSAGWELDLFGRNRRLAEASEAELLAAGYTVEDTMLSVCSEIVTDYVALRYAQASLRLALETLEAEEASAEIARARAASGFYAGLEADAAEASIAAARAAIPPRQAAIASAVRALEQLCALPPFALEETLSGDTGAALPVAPAPPGTAPAEVLARRPDVRIAEAQLHAATARIGAARAARFPSIDLSAGAALTASSLSSWSDALKSLSFGGVLNLPLFQGGALAAAEDLARAQADEALLTYHDTVLAAVHEAQGEWTELASARARQSDLEAAVTHSEKAFDAALELYRAGKIDYTDVLVRQNGLISARQSLLDNRSEICTRTVSLTKALGGPLTAPEA